MNEKDEHIEGFSEAALKLLASGSQGTEFEVPENYFVEGEKVLLLKTASVSVDDLKIPDGYFDQSTEQILSAVSSAEEVDPDFFEEQQERILAQARIAPLKSTEDMSVPKDFFEDHQKAILQRLGAEKQNGRVIKLMPQLLSYAAAAAVVGIAFFVLWPKEIARQESFAALITRAEIDEADLEYFATEDDYYELYFSETEVLALDTLVNDSLSVTTPGEMQASDADPVTLDPRTGLPMKKAKPGVKPTDGKGVLSWDDISDEELLKYLMEEGDEELINDIN